MSICNCILINDQSSKVEIASWCLLVGSKVQVSTFSEYFTLHSTACQTLVTCLVVVMSSSEWRERPLVTPIVESISSWYHLYAAWPQTRSWLPDAAPHHATLMRCGELLGAAVIASVVANYSCWPGAPLPGHQGITPLNHGSGLVRGPE